MDITTGNVEDVLWRGYRTNRIDIADAFQIGGTAQIAAAQAMRPDQVMKHLEITPEQLVSLVITGELPRPGNWGGNRVAWRADEVMVCAERLKRH